MKNLATREIKALAGKYSLRAVKQVWKLASEAKNPETRLKALELLLAYAHGKPSQTQLVGGTGDPIRTQHLADSSLGADGELARRLALLQAVVGQPQEAEDAPIDGRPFRYVNQSNGTQRTLQGPPESSNGQCTPVGEITTFDSGRGITLTRMSDDGHADHGGDWDVQHNGARVKVLRGITAEGAAAVVQALDQEGRFDDA